ncbi:DUF6624 domain-containing protein [Brevundimonas sp. GCM10030266]|uniref:DUF6624 domain-containing protein n=1 Tax=Brevundimonas sp. GCM10030266 TaxID=3273386 RepID=UPI0036226B51
MKMLAVSAATLTLLLGSVGCASNIGPIDQGSASRQSRNVALASEIQALFEQDQAMLATVAQARSRPHLKGEYERHLADIRRSGRRSFYDVEVYTHWAAEPEAPAEVVEYVAFRARSHEQLLSIIEKNGWPTRGMVGDEAAAMFMFVFGHDDGSNDWRMTQRPAIERVFREDRLNPRMFAHLMDRLEVIGGRPQIYGTIMGPSENGGSLYEPLSDTADETDERRVSIGLPTMQQDLAKFTAGASIGPYMTPMTPDFEYTIADVWVQPT